MNPNKQKGLINMGPQSKDSGDMEGYSLPAILFRKRFAL